MLDKEVTSKETIDGFELEEILRQEYLDCSFSAGLVSNHPVDECYLRMQRNGKPEEEMLILLRRDELAAICWVGTGVLWSILIGEVGSK